MSSTDTKINTLNGQVNKNRSDAENALNTNFNDLDNKLAKAQKIIDKLVKYDCPGKFKD